MRSRTQFGHTSADVLIHQRQDACFNFRPPTRSYDIFLVCSVGDVDSEVPGRLAVLTQLNCQAKPRYSDDSRDDEVFSLFFRKVST